MYETGKIWDVKLREAYEQECAVRDARTAELLAARDRIALLEGLLREARRELMGDGAERFDVASLIDAALEVV